MADSADPPDPPPGTAPVADDQAAEPANDDARKAAAKATKELRRDKQTEMSSRASEISRAMLAGVLALGYGIYSGDSAFAKAVVDRYGPYLEGAIALSATGIIFDFLQYQCGYLAATDAFRNEDGNFQFDAKSWKYQLWNAFYYLKTVAVFGVCILIATIAILFLTSRKPQQAPQIRVSYITFDAGQDRVASIFYPMLASLSSGLDREKVKSLELTGSADPTGDSADNRRLAARRAENVRKALIDAGIAPEKIRIGPPLSGVSSRPSANIAERSVRIRLEADADK